MRERLLKFMEIEKLTASRLAEILGVQPATISHILSGRNKPSFEFIEKMLLRFPKVNPEWLLLGKSSLYRPEIIAPQNQNPVIPQAPPAHTLFSVSEPISPEAPGSIDQPTVTPTAVAQSSPAADPKQKQEIISNEVSDTDIERIVIFLKNGTCIPYRLK